MKTIDETAGRIGRAMISARHVCRLTRDDVADLLHIMPNDLVEYERGHTKIPHDILERIFMLGYKTMHLRKLERMYRQQRWIFRKIKQTVLDSK